MVPSKLPSSISGVSPKRTDTSPKRSGTSPKRASQRSSSRSPTRQSSTSSPQKSVAMGSSKTSRKNKGNASGKKSLTSASSIRTRLLSAKKGHQVEDNKPKKVSLKTTGLAELGLRVEDISFSGLTQLPGEIFIVTDVGELDVSGNNLRTIPTDIAKLTQLRALNLSQNSIKCTSNSDFSGLPRELSRLRWLHTVAISECNLRFVPPALFECVSIKRLDLSRNKFQLLPADIGNLVDLEYLNVSETSIKTLPPEIAYCERLREINMYGNVLDTLPDTMRELRDLTELKLNTRSFHSNIDDYMNKLLKNEQIKSEHIPAVLLDIPELRTLDLDGTRINNLPEDNSCKLEELYISNNYFRSLPRGLKTLPHLLMVDISHNSLGQLPDELPEYFPNIRILRLNHNSLSTLPPSLCRLITLEELEVGNNQLLSLPQQLGNLVQLRVLRVPNNKIVMLPDSLCQLLDLETLELTNNRIGSLPLRLFNLTKLKIMHHFSHMKPMGLWLHKNPIEEPPEVIWKGVQIRPLYNYLRKLQIRKTENLQPLKMILLGASGSGKTTLIRTLSTGKSISDTSENHSETVYLSATEQSNMMKKIARDVLIENMEQPSHTSIASIQHWQSENALRFCTFDLGGANIYRIVHQFMLDRKALYLLVFDINKFSTEHNMFSEQFGYWLDLLQLHVPGVVIKVVATHCEQREMAREMEIRVKEAIQQYLEHHKAELATELLKLNNKIDELNRRVAGEEINASSNLTDFDPLANIRQLEYQRQQLEDLLKNPLRIEADIALVSSASALEGIADLMADIELITINKQLMPHCQRYIPSAWKKMKVALKKRSGLRLTWAQVCDTADKFKIHGDYLNDCMEYLHDCGEVLWIQTHNKLKNFVFHKPHKLIDVFRGVFYHDLEHSLNYDDNKSFSSIGKLNKTQFKDSKERLLRFGEISRQMLLSLWYYLPMSRDDFLFNYELLSDFDLAYIIPQPDIPTSNSFCEPLLIVPWYVKEGAEQEELLKYWRPDVEEGQREMEIVYSFPLQFPVGAFERLSSTLQTEAELRIDWTNTVYIETSATQMLVRCIRSINSSEVSVIIQVRSEQLRSAMQQLATIHHIWVEILTAVPGLVWNISHYTARRYNKPEALGERERTEASSESTISHDGGIESQRIINSRSTLGGDARSASIVEQADIHSARNLH